ncbi:YceI family protein [Saccharopolyspora sp. ASAGF58]|uniref:YceI family protein n=1 Tax=Saccharopolyspora TaxID=1835 RepID=UPI00143FD2EC|nr:YceI family protein [Saccharopolyspora sp. ASAGF58]QIZ35560.1 YceI family protein [Saccharopolyspora sp. ASAGF58]
MTTETTALQLTAGRWALDPFHSSVGFSIRHLGVSKVRGRFAEVDAELVVGETLDDSTITATVAIASIDTGNADRDAHVLAPDLLDAEKRPTMTFRSTRLRGEGEDWSLEGELTIGEVTKPITFEVEFGGVGDVFDGSRHAGFEATGEIRRSDYGINFGAGEALLGNVVKIQLDVQFVEPK